MPLERVLKKFKEGTLKSGSGKKVTDYNQAIAIGLTYKRKKKNANSYK